MYATLSPVDPEPDISYGRGQPLSLALPFGDIRRFNVRGEIRRYDWLKRTHSLGIHTDHIQKCECLDQSQRCISPRILNHEILQNDSASDSGLTPLISYLTLKYLILNTELQTPSYNYKP